MYIPVHRRRRTCRTRGRYNFAQSHLWVVGQYVGGYWSGRGCGDLRVPGVKCGGGKVAEFVGDADAGVVLLDKVVCKTYCGLVCLVIVWGSSCITVARRGCSGHGSC